MTIDDIQKTLASLEEAADGLGYGELWFEMNVYGHTRIGYGPADDAVATGDSPALAITEAALEIARKQVKRAKGAAA